MTKRSSIVRIDIVIVSLLLLLTFVLSFSNCKNENIKLPENKGLIVSFIDVGQGDSILFSFKDGENILIDGGEANNKALDFLNAVKIDKLDKIIATHPHSDHIGGLTQIINSHIEIKSIWTNNDISTTPDYEKFLDAIEKKGLKIDTVSRGDKIPIGKIQSIPITLDNETYLICNSGFSKELLLSLDRIKSLLNCNYAVLDAEKKIILKRNGNILEFSFDNNEMIYDGRKTTIPFPPVKYKESYLLPFGKIISSFGGNYTGPEFKFKITYNSQEIKLKLKSTDSYMLLNGKYLYLPLRFISEYLGTTVMWDANTKKITLKTKDYIIEMWIGSNKMYVNGVLMDLEIPPLTMNGKTIVPVTKIVEYLGGKIEVNFDSSNLKASIPEKYMEVLNPPKKLFGDLNNNSIVIKLIYDNISFMFNSDAEKEAEKSILGYGLNLKANILKLGHHGSSSSSSKVYLQAVSPEIAVYMAGKDNTYGHPHKETINLLKDMGIKIYGTDVNGTIILSTDGKSYSILTQR
jgi:beta-lactamase superfamily II metal-dependent hydrolase